MQSSFHTSLCVHTQNYFLEYLQDFFTGDSIFRYQPVAYMATNGMLLQKRMTHHERQKYQSHGFPKPWKMACFIFLEKKLNFSRGISATRTTRVGPETLLKARADTQPWLLRTSHTPQLFPALRHPPGDAPAPAGPPRSQATKPATWTPTGWSGASGQLRACRVGYATARTTRY